MTKNIVVVGDSCLSALITRKLDRRLANFAHITITYITRDNQFVCPSRLSTLLGSQKYFTKAELYSDVRVVRAVVKQINIPDHRIVTTSGVIEYDLLILDQTPTYLASEIRKIGQSALRMINEVKAKLNRGSQVKARVTFAGSDGASWQLALLLADDLSSLSGSIRRSLILQAQLPTKNDQLKQFLTLHGVESRKTVAPLPGMTVASAQSPLEGRRVRGALLDDKNHFIVNASLNLDQHPELIVINGLGRNSQNLLRVDDNLASRIAANVELYLNGRPQRPISWPRQAFLLTTGRHSYLQLDRLVSSRLRARLVNQLEKRFYRRLFGV